MQPSVTVWQQADLDSIPVPRHCNLPDVVVNVLKHSFLGKTVLQYEGVQTGVQDVVQQKQLKAWKTQLLQVCIARADPEFVVPLVPTDLCLPASSC